jgi:hypothetical protein
MTKARDLGDNAQNTKPKVVNAKADLIVGTGSDAADRLAVGSNGETLVADSSASTGLRWQGNFAAGKNAIINGDFRINQRGFTSTTTDGAYGFDRFFFGYTGGTSTYSAQTFTTGTAPVAGYEAINFARIVTTGQSAAGDRVLFNNRIEDVRTFAGQTVTVSFWAKANSGTPSVTVELVQNFGSGGSPSSGVTGIGSVKIPITTSWARYTATISVPSISGKSIGTDINSSFVQCTFWLSAGSDFNTRSNTLGLQNNTFDFWGVQVEAGSVATAFQTATGTLAGELAACQRYYQRYGGQAAYQVLGTGMTNTTTNVYGLFSLPVPMRVIPTSVDFSTLVYQQSEGGLFAISSAAFNSPGLQCVRLDLGITGGTANRPGQILTNNSTSAYVGFSAEL